jgi:hypothetical protein
MIGVIKMCVVSCLLAVPASAIAQAPAKPPASDTTNPAAQNDPARGPCTPGDRGTVGSGSRKTAPDAGNDKSLSDRLAQSGGVICPPPAVDPNIKTPAPDTGRMPVIKPPGTPGGNQDVQPK